MRVNITYSVELEEVPAEVHRILEECESNFRSIHGDLDHTIGSAPLDSIEKLNEIRISLTKLDLKLSDAMQILTGYVQATSQIPEMKQAAIREQEKAIHESLASELEEGDGATVQEV